MIHRKWIISALVTDLAFSVEIPLIKLKPDDDFVA